MVSSELVFTVIGLSAVLYIEWD